MHSRSCRPNLIWLAAAMAACVLALGSAAVAQNFPTKTVKFVMPAAPGSSPDRVSRMLAARLNQSWGVPVIVENRPGATGTVGSEYVARSAPDGHTALFAFTSVVQAPVLLPKVPYDIEKDFEPVSLVAYAAAVLLVRADSNIRTVADYLNAAKNPNAPVSYGTFGSGSSFHIYGETLKRAARANMVMIPYKGEALSLSDLLGGQIQSSINSVGISSAHVRAGRLRALAAVSPVRPSALPDVPTFAELGFPQLDAVGWFGVLVPAGTPKAVVEKLSADINTALKLPDVSKNLRDSGIDPVGTTPARFAEILRVEAGKWKRMIQEAGIKAQE